MYIAQAQPVFLPKLLNLVEKLVQNLGYFCNFQKTTQSKLSPNRLKFAQSGYPDQHPRVDVMIKIFRDFRRKIWRFSKKPML
jgi:hypothetical protein